MHLYKNTKLFSGATLICTLIMLTSVLNVYAKDITDEKETAVVQIAEDTSEKEVESEEAEEEETEEVEEEIVETEVVEEESADTVSATSEAVAAASYVPASSDPLTPEKGVVYYNGHRETYYSQQVLPGGGLEIPGRHVAADGTIRDAEGYICVASSDYAKGTVVETSLGTGKVYDSGCASGTIDIYTNW